MESPMKSSKRHEESRSGDCSDRISSLPDELLGYMLSFLPTKFAVSTSILSKRWRYLFTTTTSLSFDDAPCFGSSRLNKEIDAARKIRFKKFVYNVLESHQISHIEIFSLVCGGTYDPSDLEAWVGKAVQKGVEELHYKVLEPKGCLPSGLFICETLRRLKVSGSRRYEIEIPLSAWLPRLKILHLEYLRFSNYDSLQRLFSGCELLEELTLIYCECYTDDDGITITARRLKVLVIEDCSFKGGLLEIDAPNLEYLTYGSNTWVNIVPSWKNSCSLVKAELEFYYIQDEYCRDSFLYDSELLKAAAYKVTNLSLLSDSIEVLFKQADHEQMPDFPILTRLYLCTVPHCPYDEWKHVTSLLEKSPQLEHVVLYWGFNSCNCYRISCPAIALIPYSCHVKVIEVHQFRGTVCSLLYLGHLLRIAGVLERLILHKNNALDELCIRKALSMFPRASRDCCIEVI